MKVQDILRMSEPAICGIMEREISVRPSEVSKTKATLKQKGYIIIGTGAGLGGKTKIWFNPSGVNL